MASWDRLRLLAAAALALMALAVWIVFRIRRRKVDFEKRRRMHVNLRGRLGDAIVTGIEDGVLYYEYSVRGVAYATSQEIVRLGEYLPPQVEMLIGHPVSLKYTPRNPA